MKNKLIKYRSIVVIATSLIFNLVSSLLVWHPEGQKFNVMPMTVTEWVCDIISTIWFFVGILMMFFDVHQNEKRRLKNLFMRQEKSCKKDGYFLEISEKESK